MPDSGSHLFDLNAYQRGKYYILVLFWSADCNHCKEMIAELYSRPQQVEVRQRLDIIDISLDETDGEIEAWQTKIKELEGWIHLLATEGVRSDVAKDYYILSVPIVILLNANSKEIIALPETAGQMNDLITF